MNDKEKIVVIGGGFAGINFIKKIDRERYDVTIVDRNNFNCFPPLFYQVASSGLDPASIAFPLRREIRKLKHEVDFHMGNVERIDLADKKIHTDCETIKYDRLIIAAGTTNNFFNMPDLHEKVYTLKSIGEAMRCRNAILEHLERAAIASDEAEKRRLLNFVVIGGGPTGVEIAGALGEMKRYILKREYPSIKEDDVTVTLVEGTDRVLRTMSEKSSRAALEALKSLCVEVRLNLTMSGYDGSVLSFSDGTTVNSSVVIWTAGITGEQFVFEGGELEKGPGNRFIVDEFNRAPGHDDVFILGDLCVHTDQRYPRGCPQLAQVAIQQARTLAKNLNKGSFDNRFDYRDMGSMATVGRNRAVADLRHMQLSGFPAWFAWMFVHLMSLMGMRNRFVVLTNWIWAYFTYPTSLRLLLRASRYPLRRYK